MNGARLTPAQLALLELVETGDRTRVRLRVSPGAKFDAVLGVHGGGLKLCVTAPPDRGRANDAVVGLLARVLGVAPAAVELTAGHGSRTKVARVALDADSIRARLAAYARS